jgi:hypothetical protein
MSKKAIPYGWLFYLVPWYRFLVLVLQYFIALCGSCC